MKWVKITGVIVVFVLALYFAYQSFESSFNPRRGWEEREAQAKKEGRSGGPPMNPEMQRVLREFNEKKKQEEAKKKAASESSENKGEHTADTRKKEASEQTHKNGGG